VHLTYHGGQSFVGWPLSIKFVICTTLEGITNLDKRTPVVDPEYGNCRGVFQISQQPVGAYVYYVVAIIYDLVITAICMMYLLRYKAFSNSTLFSKFIRMMFYDGLNYFVALTAVNILNLILYRQSEAIQTAAASLGYCVTWIMSKRLIIHLHAVSMERNENLDAPLPFSQSLSSPHIQTQFERKPTSVASLDLTIPEFDIDGMEAGVDWPEDMGVYVQRVEKTVQVERRPRIFYPLEEDSFSRLQYPR